MGLIVLVKVPFVFFTLEVDDEDCVHGMCGRMEEDWFAATDFL